MFGAVLTASAAAGSEVYVTCTCATVTAFQGTRSCENTTGFIPDTVIVVDQTAKTTRLLNNAYQPSAIRWVSDRVSDGEIVGHVAQWADNSFRINRYTGAYEWAWDMNDPDPKRQKYSWWQAKGMCTKLDSLPAAKF